ncbi:hypothetical protein ACSSS7_003055 [Eimeria intestinalis]
MALRNKETVICAMEKQKADNYRLQETMLEGRGPGIMAALETTANSTARGTSVCTAGIAWTKQQGPIYVSLISLFGRLFGNRDDPVQILESLKFANECLRMEYRQRKEDVQDQVKQSEQALRIAEEANQQLQEQLLSLQKSSRQQSSRIEHMQAELRRLNITSQKHVFEVVKLASSRSVNSKDCPYATVTELLGLRGLSLHLTGEDIQRHERDCRAKQALQRMGLLSKHAENLATGGGNLLEVYFNMLSRDAVLCLFLYDLLCCLAYTFARLSAKHEKHSEQWRQLRWRERNGRKRRRLPNQQKVCTRQAQEEGQNQELEEGELEPGSSEAKEASDTRPVTPDGAASVGVDGYNLHQDTKGAHEDSSGSHARANDSISTIGDAKTGDCREQTGGTGAHSTGRRGRRLDDVASEASGPSAGSACAFTASGSNKRFAAALGRKEAIQGPACLCGGRGCGGVGVNGLCLAGAMGRESSSVEASGATSAPGLPFDIRTCVLEQYELDDVDKATE